MPSHALSSRSAGTTKEQWPFAYSFSKFVDDLHCSILVFSDFAAEALVVTGTARWELAWSFSQPLYWWEDSIAATTELVLIQFHPC